MVAGLEDAENSPRRQHRGDGIKASRKRLPDDDHIRPDTFMHVGEELAGSAQAGLDFVHHQEHPILAANLRGLFQKPGRWNDDTGLTLDRLH